MVKLYLTQEGFRVVTAMDGQEALFVARYERPDLILLDLMMPHMGGYEFMRAYTKEADTPIVILTAKVLVGEGSSKRMLAMTSFAFMPMAAQQLLRVLDAMTISSTNLAALAASQLNATGLLGKIINQAIGVFTIFGLLTVLLNTYAVSANYGADTRKSVTVTVAAYLIYVLLLAFIS